MEPRRHGDTETPAFYVRLKFDEGMSVVVDDLVEILRQDYFVELTSEDHWSTQREKRRQTIHEIESSGHPVANADMLLLEVERDRSLYGDGVDLRIHTSDGVSIAGYACERSISLFSSSMDSGPRRFNRLVEHLTRFGIGEVEHGEL